MAIRSLRLLPVVLASVALPAAAQDGYTLDFAWPAGAARVSVETTTTASVMGQPQTLDMQMSYRMEVSAEGDELEISYSDYVMDGSSIEVLAESGSPDELTRLVANAQPDIRVSREGEFLRLADYPALRASLEELLAAQRAELAATGMGEMFDEFVEASLSEESMSTGAELQWKQQVGYWVGRTLPVGGTVTVPGEMPFPVVSQVPVPLDTELRLVGPAPCPEASGGDTCVELVSTAAPDPEEMRNLMDAFMARMAEQAGGSDMEMEISAMSVEMTSTLIAEASTLRPFRLETRAATSLDMDVMGMAQTMSNDQTTVTTWAWER